MESRGKWSRSCRISRSVNEVVLDRLFCNTEILVNICTYACGFYDSSYDEQLEIFLFCSAFINHVSFILKKICCADRSWKLIFRSWISHGEVMENHCWKRVVTLKIASHNLASVVDLQQSSPKGIEEHCPADTVEQWLRAWTGYAEELPNEARSGADVSSCFNAKVHSRNGNSILFYCNLITMMYGKGA